MNGEGIVSNPDRSCITTWFPPLLELGIPVPRTEIVNLGSSGYKLMSLLDGKMDPGTQDCLDAIAVTCDKIGYPCFLRTGHLSGKHNWEKTCYVPSRESVPSHVAAIVEENEMMTFGMLPIDTWASRELLATRPLFQAFYGRMPITREFRFFVRDGQVCHVQPYWPQDSIQSPDAADWQDKLAEASVLSPPEREWLTNLSELVGARLGGYWSIDWLETWNGWFLTDMADGESSFQYDPSHLSEQSDPQPGETNQ